MSYPSETNNVRDILVGKWVFPESQNGIDLGFGGDPLSVYSIAMDLPRPYATTHDEHGVTHHQHLRGDATNLHWFRDGVLDYVYSSHLLEDFANTEEILVEWLRVLKPGGSLILCLPDQTSYSEHCSLTGQPQNGNHKQPRMARKWLCDLLCELGCNIAHSMDIPPYSFLVVAEKS